MMPLPPGRSRPNSAPESPRRALMAPFACTVALAAFWIVPSIHRNASLAWSLAAAVAVLVVWECALWLRARASERRLRIDIVLRQQHYLQACAQASVLLYWGWYWRPVYDQAPLIAAQLLFGYAFHMLLTLSRRDTYVFGFGPVPIILGINLFLWFTPEWFLLQLLMIAVGFAAKEFLTWEKGGRRVHIFNPSSFPLALCSLVLIVTSTTHHTLGQEIATTLDIPPYIALWIFLAALPGQYVFGVTSMTMSAVVTLFTLGQAYFWATGTYFFIDSHIPAAVFLGMHLLFTDPSTSPRTGVGRVVFGVMYALSVAALYAGLDALGAPTFYDKLLAVPLLNLTIQWLDQLARSDRLERRRPDMIGLRAPPRRTLAYMSAWALTFLLISASEGVGDVRQSRGVPLWQRACSQGRSGACKVLATILTQHCVEGSAWACNELGVLTTDGEGSSPLAASDSFRRSCALGLAAGCNNERRRADGPRSWQRPPPSPADYVILLQTEARGETLMGNGPRALLDRACSQGWADACRDHPAAR